MNLYWIKVDVDGFGSCNHHQDLDIRIVHIVMDACWDNRSKWKIMTIYIFNFPLQSFLNCNFFHMSTISHSFAYRWFQVFLSNTNNVHTLIWFQVFLSNTNTLCAILFQIPLPCLIWIFVCTVIWFQVFLSNTNNVHTVISNSSCMLHRWTNNEGLVDI